MALVIGVGEGGSFYVDETKCTVESMRDEQHFKIRVFHPFFENLFEITDKIQVEILPEVLVSAGPVRPGLASLAIDAPRHMTILRERLYVGSRG